MSLESANFIKQLVATNPEGTDPKSQGDDHLRMLKLVLQTQFSGFTEGIPITKTESQINAALYAGAGAFGLGGGAIAITEAQYAAADLPTGFYYVTEGGLGTLPPGLVNAFLVYIDLGVAGYAARFLLRADSGAGLGACYGQVKYNGTWGGYRVITDTINRPPQTTAIDTTPASLLNPQSFGLGVTLAAGAANLNEVPFAKANYNGRWYGNTWAAGFPTGESGQIAIVEWKSYSNDWGEQRFISIQTGRSYRRTWTSGSTFSAWREESFINGQFLGGAVNYRTDNGVMRQWGRVAGAGMPINTTLNIGFATPFSQIDSVVANCTNYSSGNWTCLSVTGWTNSQFTVGYTSSSGLSSGPINWQAVGIA